MLVMQNLANNITLFPEKVPVISKVMLLDIKLEYLPIYFFVALSLESVIDAVVLEGSLKFDSRARQVRVI